MGKLVEKLQKIGQSSGGSLGFIRARTPAQVSRPAAVIVSLTDSDSASATAAAKNGADALLVTGWTPETNVSTITSALEGTETLWGVEVVVEGQNAGDAITSARDAGASFAVIGQNTPIGAALAEVERFDTVIAVEPPEDELSLVMLRAENMLPAQAALLQTQLGNAALARLTVRDFARLTLAFESIRFPTLLALTEAPDIAHVKTLVRLGADGIVLPSKGVSADQLGASVKALREELEKTPARSEDRASVAIGGLVEQGGQSLNQPHKEPEKE